MEGKDDRSPREPEWVDDGDEEILPDPPHPGHRWRLWLVALAAGGIALTVVLAMQPGQPNPARPTRRPSSAARSSTAPTSAGATSTAVPAVAVTDVGHPLLGIGAGWDVFALSTGTMLRIEFARGRITRTVVPTLASSGPVSFLAAPHAAIIRPWDFVPGYLVPDGRASRALPGALASGGVLLPGPAVGQFWIQSGSGASAPVVLVDPDGRPVASGRSSRIAIPRTMNSFPSPDGAGFVLLTGLGGVYDLRPAGLRRITTGAVLAVGPTRWLAAECNKQARCSLVVIDQATGARHVLRRFSDDPAGVSGVISPNGRTAALLLPENAGGPPRLHLIDLGTGADRRIPLQFSQNVSAFPDDPLVWSPDSRWLFASDFHEQLNAVDTRTGREQGLGVELPPVQQLAIR